MYRLGFLFTILFFPCVFAQGNYTLQSEYEKQVKKYPEIQKVSIFEESEIKQILDISYCKIKERKLLLDAFLLRSEKPLPAVVLVHGGGWKSGNKKMLHPLAQKISTSGFQVFTVEYRLSPEAIFPAALYDVVAAVNYLRKNAKKYNIDKNKIAILGTSAGGQLATLAGQYASSEVKAIVNIDGILAFHHPESKEGDAASLWLGGNYNQTPKTWEQASPLHHTSSDSPPILFINSQFERFHAGRDDMIQKLNNFGVYSEIKEIKNSPHTFWLFYPWFDEVVKYTTDFLNRMLKE